MRTEKIGEIICQSRQNRKMTQEEFASRLGVTPQAVSKWERGSGLPDISLIEGICTTLQISANYLLGCGDHRMTEDDDAVMEQEIRNNMFAEPLVIEFGEAVIPHVIKGLETDYVNWKRKQLVQETGILMPLIRLRDSTKMDKTAYRVRSYDKTVAEGNLETAGEEAYTAIIDCAVRFCQEHYADILNKQLVKTIVEHFKEQYSGAVEGLVPERSSYLQLQRRLQEILREGGSIRDLIHILEEMEEKLSGNGD